MNITEPIYDKDLDYSKAAAPFLAYGMNGSVTSVMKAFFLLFKNDNFKYFF